MCLTYFNFGVLIMMLFDNLPLNLTMNRSLLRALTFSTLKQKDRNKRSFCFNGGSDEARCFAASSNGI